MDSSGRAEDSSSGRSRSRRTLRDPKINSKMLVYRNASPGYWAVFLLPIGIYFADRKFHNQSAAAVVILLFNSIFLTFLHVSKFNLIQILQRLKILFICVSLSTCLYCYMNGGVFYEYVSYVILNFTFPYVFKNLIKYYPKSFTFGEGMVVTSAFVYNFWSASQSLPFPISDLQEKEDPIVISLFLQMAFFGTVLLLRVVLIIAKPWRFFVLEEVFCIWSKSIFMAFSSRLINPIADVWFLIYWSIDFFWGDVSRRTFLIFWTAMVVVAGFFTNLVNSQHRITTTVDRKFFHLLVSIVYFPAIFNDFNLIYFCSSIVLFGLIVLEAIRVWRLEFLGKNIGESLNDLISAFRDEKDAGRLILTPIYLLAGCSAPIWITGLYYKNENNSLTAEEMAGAISGVLSIGVGDTFASIIGSNYGVTKWPGSKKTILGTLSSILSQLCCVILFCAFDFIPYNTLSVTALFVSCVLNAIVEASTDQIDNLVVPLTAFTTIHVITGIFGAPS